MSKPKLPETVTALIEEIVAAVVEGVLAGLGDLAGDEEPAKKTPDKKTPDKKTPAKKKSAPPEDEDDDEGEDDESGDDDDEDEAPPPKKKTTRKTATKKEEPAKKRGAKKKSADDEDDGETECPVEVGDEVEIYDDEEEEWAGPFTVNAIDGHTFTLFDPEEEDEFEIPVAEDFSDIRQKVAKKKVSSRRKK